MSDYAIDVSSREGSGKGVARKLRQAGRIPAVCYGKGLEPVSLSLDAHALEMLLRKSEKGMNTLIDLKVDGGGSLDGTVVLVKELQRDPVRSSPLHADLYAVDLEEKLEVSVPVHLTGRAVGVEMGGGILDHALREIVVSCYPRAIPDEIPAEVTQLDVGGSLHVRDLALPEGVELVTDGDLSVVSVVAPTVEEEAIPAEGEEAVEVAAAEAAPAAAEAPAEKAEASEGGGEEKSGD